MLQTEKNDTELVRAIKQIIIGSRNDRDLVNRIEALVMSEVQAARQEGSEISLPAFDPDGTDERPIFDGGA